MLNIFFYLLVGALFYIVLDGVIGKEDIMLFKLIVHCVFWPILGVIYFFIFTEERLGDVVMFKGEGFRRWRRVYDSFY